MNESLRGHLTRLMPTVYLAPEDEVEQVTDPNSLRATLTPVARPIDLKENDHEV